VAFFTLHFLALVCGCVQDLTAVGGPAIRPHSSLGVRNLAGFTTDHGENEYLALIPIFTRVQEGEPVSRR
jgi:hypothetical protein